MNMNILAFIDLSTLQKAGKQAPQLIERIEARGMKILLLSPWQKDSKTEAWLKGAGLDKHQRVFNDTAPTSFIEKKRYDFKDMPTRWKVFMVQSLLESFRTGEAAPCDLIIFIDADPGACASIAILLDPRILLCRSLEEATTIELVPKTIEWPQ